MSDHGVVNTPHINNPQNEHVYTQPQRTNFFLFCVNMILLFMHF